MNSTFVRVPQPPSTAATAAMISTSNPSSKNPSCNNSRNNSFHLHHQNQQQRKSLNNISTNANNISSSDQSLHFSSLVPESAKKATLEYLNYLQQHHQKTAQCNANTTSSRSPSILLSKMLNLAKQGKFNEAAAFDQSHFCDEATNTKFDKFQMYALSLTSTAIFCGCAPPRFEDAKKKIIEAYKFSSNNDEISQIEYNFQVIELLEQKYNKMVSENVDHEAAVNIWRRKYQQNPSGAQDLIDTFYTIAPSNMSEETNANGNDEEPKKINNDNANHDQGQPSTSTSAASLSLSPPKNGDSDKKKEFISASSPFVNILSPSSSSTSLLSANNLTSLSELISSSPNSQSYISKIGCCQICLLRSLTFGLIALQNQNSPTVPVDLDARNIFVQNENPLSAILRQNIAEDPSRVNAPRCCDIAFHNFVWFQPAQLKKSSSSSTAPDSSTKFLKMIVEEMMKNSQQDEEKSHFENLLLSNSLNNNHSNCLDSSILKVLTPFLLKEQNTKKSDHGENSTKIKNASNQDDDDALKISFMDAFNLYLRPATKLALKTQGTLHIRLSREFLFASVTQFFYSMKLPSVNLHQNYQEHDDDENEAEGNDEISTFLLRPLSVSFDGESGIDAGQGGLTNDMLQRYVEQFENAWRAQFFINNNNNNNNNEKNNNDDDHVEREFGDSRVRSLAFGRVLAKCCLEDKRRVSLKYADFFTLACVCGGDLDSWESIFQSETENRNNNNNNKLNNLAKIIGKIKNPMENRTTSQFPRSSAQKVDILLQQQQQTNHHDILGMTNHENQHDDWIVSVTMGGELSQQEIMLENQQLEQETLRLFDKKRIDNIEKHEINSTRKSQRLILVQNQLDAIRDGFVSVIKNALPPTLSKFLMMKASRSKNADNDDEEGDVGDILKFTQSSTTSKGCSMKESSPNAILTTSNLIFSLCCAGNRNGNNINNNNNNNFFDADDNEEISGKQVVQVLEFRGWSDNNNNNNNTYPQTLPSSALSSPSLVLKDSTPYYLCCWLHYQATPEMRRKFLRFATCIPNLSPELIESRIIIRRDPDRLMARTCLRTLHLPSFPTLQDLQESLELAIHVSENLDQEMHD